MNKNSMNRITTGHSKKKVVIEDEAAAARSEPSGVREKRTDLKVKKMEGESSDINESADAFIRRFRQQLQIQRLESFENYKQMLARGT